MESWLLWSGRHLYVEISKGAAVHLPEFSELSICPRFGHPDIYNMVPHPASCRVESAARSWFWRVRTGTPGGRAESASPTSSISPQIPVDMHFNKGSPAFFFAFVEGSHEETKSAEPLNVLKSGDVRPLSKWAHLFTPSTISLHGGETLQPCPDSLLRRSYRGP